MATAGMGAKRRYTMHISETSCLCAAGRSARRPSGRGGATRAAPRTSARTARGAAATTARRKGLRPRLETPSSSRRRTPLRTPSSRHDHFTMPAQYTQTSMCSCCHSCDDWPHNVVCAGVVQLLAMCCPQSIHISRLQNAKEDCRLHQEGRAKYRICHRSRAGTRQLQSSSRAQRAQGQRRSSDGGSVPCRRLRSGRRRLRRRGAGLSWSCCYLTSRGCRGGRRVSCCSVALSSLQLVHMLPLLDKQDSMARTGRS